MFSKIGFEPTTSRLQIMCATHCATLYIGNPIFAELVYLSCNVTLLREARFRIFAMQANTLCYFNQSSRIRHFNLSTNSFKSVLFFSSRLSIFFLISSGSTSSVVFSFTYASTTPRGLSSFVLLSFPRS